MAGGLFAVIRTRTAAWNDALPLEGQKDWRAHADFMNALHADGFVVLAGLLEGTRDVLLVVRAVDPGEIRGRLARDPWHPALLDLTRIERWELRLGSLA
jgi:hypothetical protein